ncbi:hypothetical protein BIW11_05248 [Tropilaelaps mercedesae]|uniref:Uncharacterized protein n=1 Tax=Tropilaelaps mercedesae TaxID=418985 RepID=A0A1V9Y342_9ACAR|nr:hypothetical protein BIW11_05248 [Tropilaelaps mercedesae]
MGYLDFSDKRSMSQLMWQKRCPVVSVVVHSRVKPLTAEAAILTTWLYGPELRSLIYLGLPRYHQPTSFAGRCDSPLLLLIRQRIRLKRLVICEVSLAERGTQAYGTVRFLRVVRRLSNMANFLCTP